MTIKSWRRGLTHDPAPSLKESRRSAADTRDTNGHWLGVERLEDRTLLSYDFGFAFGLGSTGTENALGMAADAAGNVLVAGVFSSASLDLGPGPGTYHLPNAGGYDGYAAKYDATGNLLWGVQVGGTGNGNASELAVDGAGNVLIAGGFAGSIAIGDPGRTPVTLTNGGISEGYLAKLDPAGNVLWARTCGAAADPRSIGGITADAAGNVYATGAEGRRLFVAKYSADGTAVWTQIVSGGTGKIVGGNVTSASGADLAVDANSNDYVAGIYRGKIDFNPDPKKTNSLSSVGGPLSPTLDAFILKLNATGAYVWSGSMGGTSDDGASSVAVDGSGNVHVSGYYSGVGPNDFDPGQGTLNLPGSGGFVVKLDPNRNLIWGRGDVGTRDMALDAAGNVYTTGPFVLVSKLNNSGSFVWATQIDLSGPGSYGQSYGIAVDGSGNIYTTGYLSGTADFDPGAGTYSLTSTLGSNGNPTMDAFVSKLVPSSSLLAAAGPELGVVVFHKRNSSCVDRSDGQWRLPSVKQPLPPAPRWAPRWG